MSQGDHKLTDAEIERLVIVPGGGLSAFTLKACRGFKLIQHSSDGMTLDLSIEDDELAQAVVEYLERMGAPENH